MLTHNKKHVRLPTARRILKACNTAQLPTPRQIQVPLIVFNASTYINLINLQENLTEPPILKNLSDQEIQNVVETCGERELFFIRLPCHTQAVETAVKIRTEASISQCTKKSRLGAINAKLESRNKMPRFETKMDFNPK
jgi:hypothetical protein